MAEIKRLPDSEFEVMEIIWDNTPSTPMTTAQILDKLKSKRDIKIQTMLTMLTRLMDKGFLSSEKVGMKRKHTPLISKMEYIQAETKGFAARYYIKSVRNLISTFYDEQELSPAEIQDIRVWLDEKVSNSDLHGAV